MKLTHAWKTLTVGVLAAAIEIPENSRIFTNTSTSAHTTALRLNTTLQYHGDTVCEPNYYGPDLDLASCVDALEKMNNSSIVQTYTSRRVILPSEIHLPIRYLSDNGICAIDINIREGFQVQADITSGEALVNATTAVIRTCVAKNEGGVASGFSKPSLVIRFPGSIFYGRPACWTRCYRRHLFRSR